MRILAMLAVCAAAPAAERAVPYWVEECLPAESGCRAGDRELARWAFAAWAEASRGALRFEEARRREDARIRVLWAGPSRGAYGEMRSYVENGAPAADVFVRPSIAPPAAGDPLLRDAVVYLTCLHETGHALGLAHTAAFEDIMYSFGFGGDIGEYFGRYRRLLRSREDIRRHAGLSEAERTGLECFVSRGMPACAVRRGPLTAAPAAPSKSERK